MRKHWSILTVLPLFAGGVAAEVTAASPFTGVYRGTQMTLLGNCPKINRDNYVLRIEDGQFTRNWGRADLNMTVAPESAT
jgi:hypothetical protein